MSLTDLEHELLMRGKSTLDYGHAIESAATAPLLARIAELEKALKLVQQHHATAWNRGHIAGMAANRVVARDAMKAVEQDAWNNTQLTEALMAAETRAEQLERELEKPCRHDLQAEGKHPSPCAKFCEAQAFKITIRGLERELEDVRKDAERYRWLRDYHIGNDPESINLKAAKKSGLDAAIDAAKEQG